MNKKNITIIILALGIILGGLFFYFYKKTEIAKGKEVVKSSEFVDFRKIKWHPSGESLTFYQTIFGEGTYLVQRNINTLKTEKVFNEANSNFNINEGGFDWSQDGNEIIYIYKNLAESNGNEVEGLKATKLGVKKYNLLNNETKEVFSLDGVVMYASLGNIQYSTDGKKILFTMFIQDYSQLFGNYNKKLKLYLDNVFSGYNIKNSGLYIMDIDGKNLRNVDFCNIDLQEISGRIILDDNYIYIRQSVEMKTPMRERCNLESGKIEKFSSDSHRIDDIFSKKFFLVNDNLEEKGMVLMSPDSKKYIRKLCNSGWETCNDYYNVKKVKN